MSFWVGGSSQKTTNARKKSDNTAPAMLYCRFVKCQRAIFPSTFRLVEIRFYNLNKVRFRI